ncbi:2-C-methyl-D-erythritol 4-phosphate cytidylyltransferase [Aurantimicrobium minutum]|uniref:2-C-methyl-D-erythritol 4-phosphate cytidylyltransferase n=1 Tax=Aurantimicrobium minutum TaxID=708131 RepID=UPI0024762C8D|nr:2-C-methyl-D-erythritol 4-phosphate cytidylyltransferase [Aurantimicrobium minutum]MDH6239897.1 2-C-methyl-D-erythritol 4-phosphate cytidylyltransferase/2-C-methyl-D-erythritol 2,4-cyclodiphosphate synthase [Aurantimicrobium minutum]
MSGDLHVSTAVIVVAAGSGTRLGAALPKAFVDLAGQTLLERSLRSIILLPYPVQVVVVAPADFVQDAQAIVHKVAPGLESLVSVVTGGATRHDSVAAGLAVVDAGVQVVLVHDAARALTPTSVFADVDMAVQATGAGVIPALPVVDSLKQVDVTGGILGIADREQLRIAQTPQGFPRAELDAAYAAAGSADFTDDASVFAANGGVMTTIPGDEVAFKITTAWDLNRAHQVLGGIPDRHRVGTGIDVHAFGENENLWLAGLHWPGEKELSGHSDGDAVAHAICDALLSAAGLGDIGSRFGTDDPAYANASGEVFIRGTVALLEENGFDPINVSVQIVGNKPRFSPRREEAQNVLSSWVGAPVTVSATTTDGLGFTGRGEGIAAIATALVRQR